MVIVAKFSFLPLETVEKSAVDQPTGKCVVPKKMVADDVLEKCFVHHEDP